MGRHAGAEAGAPGRHSPEPRHPRRSQLSPGSRLASTEKPAPRVRTSACRGRCNNAPRKATWSLAASGRRSAKRAKAVEPHAGTQKISESTRARCKQLGLYLRLRQRTCLKASSGGKRRIKKRSMTATKSIGRRPLLWLTTAAFFVFFARGNECEAYHEICMDNPDKVKMIDRYSACGKCTNICPSSGQPAFAVACAGKIAILTTIGGPVVLACDGLFR